MGQEVDARADIFALGIVLWEMLAGRRLFLGETDYQTVKLVQQANVPSLARLNPEVDEEFEGVLVKALAQRSGGSLPVLLASSATPSRATSSAIR